MALGAVHLHVHEIGQTPITPKPGLVSAEVLVCSPVKLTKATSRFDALMYNEAQAQHMKVQGVLFERREDLQEGDVLKIQAQIELPASPLNPMQFDVAEWHRREHRSCVLLIDSIFSMKHDQTGIRSNYRRSIDEKLLDLQDTLVRGLLYAMITGDRTQLDPQIKTNFTITGIVHLLAVSGLHTGLLALLPMWLLNRSRKKAFRIFAFVVVLITVWSFAFLTGASPSVLRASAMISIVAIARLLHKRSNALNTLAGVALIMLLLSPSAFFDLGFQLSFAAVAGILLWSQPIQAFLPQCNMVMRKCASAIGVSVAAQASTSPISIWYFHQFPLYFLPANLLAVPLATAMLYLLLALLLLDSFGVPAYWLCSILDVMGHGLIRISEIISEWPSACIGGLSISAIQVIALYAMLFVFFQFLRHQRWRDIIVMALCLLAWKMSSLTTIPSVIETYCFSGDAIGWNGLQSEGNHYLISPDSTAAIPYSLKNWVNYHSAERIERREGIFLSLDSLHVWHKGKVMGVGHLLFYAGDTLIIEHKKSRSFKESRPISEGYIIVSVSSDTIVVAQPGQHTLPTPSHL